MIKQILKTFSIICLFLTLQNFQADAAKFYPLTESSEISAGCNTTLNLMLDTEGTNSPAADAIISFNPEQVDIIDQNSSVNGIQIRSGNGYEFFPGNKVDITEGKIYLSGISIMSALNGVYNHGAIIFKTKPGVTNANFNFDFTLGDTLDSNIANTNGDDVLNSVSNAQFNVNANNYCGNDTTPPQVSNLQPPNNAKNVGLESNLLFTISDNQSGVDIDSIIVSLDGILYSNGDPEFEYTGTSAQYQITINPTSPLTDGAQIYINIDGSDIIGNTMNVFKSSFNAPQTPVVAICGNGNIEGDEQCEPPGTGNCSLDCRSLVCEVTENIETACGNNIIEQGEQCEPPNTPGCSGECKFLTLQEIILATEEVSTPEISTDGTTPETSGLLGMLRFDDGGVQTKRISYTNIRQQDIPAFDDMTKDEDNDGLADVIENKYKTRPDTADTDGDGVSDLDEIVNFGTDPLVVEDNFLFTKILNYKNGDVTGVKNLFVRGKSIAGAKVKVFATSEAGTKFLLGEMVVDEANNFAITSKTPLNEGNYELLAESYDDQEKLISSSENIKITIDFSKLVPAPTIDGINDQSAIEGLTVKVENKQPYVVGRTAPNTQVFAVFQSLILTSTIISDTQTGFFTVFAPKPMETGFHKVTVYAISEDGIVSDYNSLDFEITETASLLKNDKFWLFIIITIALISGGIGAYIYYKKRKK